MTLRRVALDRQNKSVHARVTPRKSRGDLEKPLDLRDKPTLRQLAGAKLAGKRVPVAVEQKTCTCLDCITPRFIDHRVLNGLIEEIGHQDAE